MRTALLLIGIFLFGGVTGAAGMRVYDLRATQFTLQRTPEERIQAKLAVIKNKVGVDDQQAKAIEEIYRAAEPDRKQASAPCRPAMDAQRDGTEAKISEVLRPEQRPKYDAIRKRQR